MNHPHCYLSIIADPQPRAKCDHNSFDTRVLITSFMILHQFEYVNRVSMAYYDGILSLSIHFCVFIETGCVGICLNSCKIATEGFFESNMGIPLAIEPNLEDFSCKFHFGKNPPPPYLDDMYKQPCLSKCPSASVRSQAPCYAIGDSNLPNEDSHPTLGHQDIGS